MCRVTTLWQDGEESSPALLAHPRGVWGVGLKITGGRRHRWPATPPGPSLDNFHTAVDLVYYKFCLQGCFAVHFELFENTDPFILLGNSNAKPQKIFVG